METYIRINDETYISEKQHKFELENAKKEVEDNIKKETDSYFKKRQIDYIITDAANVLGIIPFDKSEEFTEFISIEGIPVKFKKFEGELKLGKVDQKTFKPEEFVLGEARYSLEYLEKCRKINNLMYNHSIPEFYIGFDADKEEYLSDQPCLIKFSGMINIIFVLAPRVGDNEIIK